MNLKLRFLLLILLIPVHGQAAPPSPDQPAAADSSRVIASLAEYQPKAAHFGAGLREAAALVEQAFALNAAHQHPQAEPLLRQALDQLQRGKFKLPRGEDEQLPLLRGLAFEGLDEQKKALEQYDATLKIQPTNILARFRRGLLLSKLNRCNDAIQEFHEVEWYLPKLRYETSYLVGSCLQLIQKQAEAEKLFEESMKLNPAYIPALKKVIQHRMSLLETTPEPEKQKALASGIESGLTVMLGKDPNDRDAALLYTRLLLSGPASGDPKARAAAAVQRVQKIVDDSQYKDDQAVHLLVQGLTKQGDLPGAEAALHRGLQATPNSKELAAAKRQFAIDQATAVPSPSPAPATAKP